MWIIYIDGLSPILYEGTNPRIVMDTYKQASWAMQLVHFKNESAYHLGENKYVNT